MVDLVRGKNSIIIYRSVTFILIKNSFLLKIKAVVSYVWTVIIENTEMGLVWSSSSTHHSRRGQKSCHSHQEQGLTSHHIFGENASPPAVAPSTVGGDNSPVTLTKTRVSPVNTYLVRMTRATYQ